MPRIFVALPLPLDVARSLAAAVPEMRALRPVAPELLHVTLAFVGSIEEGRVADVGSAVSAAVPAVRRFRVGLDTVGRFPPAGAPRVVWAGTGPAAAPIQLLGARVRAELLHRGVPFDAKPLSAHVTLARVRDPVAADEAREVAALLRRVRLPEGLAFDVEAVHVMESALGPYGPRYSSRARIALPAGDRAG